MERKQMIAYALGAAMVGGSLMGATAVLAGPTPVDVQQVGTVATSADEPIMLGATDDAETDSTEAITEAAPYGEQDTDSTGEMGSETEADAGYSEASEEPEEDEAEYPEEGDEPEEDEGEDHKDEDEDHEEDEDEYGAY